MAISAVDHDRGPEIVNKRPFEPNKVLLLLEGNNGRAVSVSGI